MGFLDRFSRDRDSDRDTDFFEDNIKPEAPKLPKTPPPSPEDPSYWERDESEWDHLKPRHKGKVIVWSATAILAIAMATAFYLRFFATYVDDAVEYGYIEHLERKGTIFKTYEGVMIPYRELHDTTRIYQRDFIFTARPEVAADLKRFELSHQPVRVGYVRYHATLPWRGASKTVVVSVDSVDPSTILPPEYRPPVHR